MENFPEYLGKAVSILNSYYPDLVKESLLIRCNNTEDCVVIQISFHHITFSIRWGGCDNVRITHRYFHPFFNRIETDIQLYESYNDALENFNGTKTQRESEQPT